MHRMTLSVIITALLMIVGMVGFFACDTTTEERNENEEMVSSVSGLDGEGDGIMPYLSPQPVVDVPPEITTASRETALNWAMNLTTDDLQRYGLVGVRGADPRADVPEDYPDREEVVEHLFLIGLWANGVESAGDQKEWIRAHENHEQGGIAFAMADRNGPDWGWYVPPSSSLDAPCTPPVVQKFYYLWRTNGSSGGSILNWSAPDAGESSRRIPINSYVQTSATPSGSGLCTMSITYKSATTQDGRFMVGQNEAANLDGYFRGIGSQAGENVRASGLPYWGRMIYDDCISTSPTGCSYNSVDEPGNTNPAPRYLNAGYSATGRHRDYFYTPCTAGCDSCWYYPVEQMIMQEGHCCVPGAGPDSCYWTTGSHQAAVWNQNDYDDPENYFYTSSGSNSQALMSRRVQYSPSAFVTAAAGNYTRGGWMNQVIFQSPINPEFYSELANDGVKTPTGTFDAAGNSQSIMVYISINDSAQWLNRKLKIGCRPFWKWNFRRDADILPYYLQLGSAGTVNCNAGGYTEYNNWNISSGNNPLYCTAGDNFWAACVTWDANYPLDHPPWKQGAGLLYPSITCVRQSAGTSCPGGNYNSTYYPMKSTLAFETDGNNPAYYAGTYLMIRYSNRKVED